MTKLGSAVNYMRASKEWGIEKCWSSWPEKEQKYTIVKLQTICNVKLRTYHDVFSLQMHYEGMLW